MNIDSERLGQNPRSIFEITILPQNPGVVDDLLNTTYPSEEELLVLVEQRGFRLGEGLPIRIPDQVKALLQGFEMTRHDVIDEMGLAVAGLGILKGDQAKLSALNNIIAAYFDNLV